MKNLSYTERLQQIVRDLRMDFVKEFSKRFDSRTAKKIWKGILTEQRETNARKTHQVLSKCIEELEKHGALKKLAWGMNESEFSAAVQNAREALGTENEFAQAAEREYLARKEGGYHAEDSFPLIQKISSFRTNDVLKLVSQRQKLYQPYGDCDIKAVRLIGADSYCVRPHRFTCIYTHQKKHYDHHLQEELERYASIANSNPLRCWDGDNTRLDGFKNGTQNDAARNTEPDALTLYLGPVGWYEYTALNERFFSQQKKNIEMPLHDYKAYTNLEALLHGGWNALSECRLSNILSTATTIVTSDGFALYSERSSDAGMTQSGLMTSAAAENINRLRDDAGKTDFTKLFNPNVDEEDMKNTTNYVPKGVPHPFAAAIQGIKRELSAEIVEAINPKSIKLLGICFDLEMGHPDALFVIAVPLKLEQVLEARGMRPGPEEHEGRLRFVPADLKSKETEEVLRKGAWVASGQAALYRAIEFIQAKMKGRSFQEVHKQLLVP